ncbi:hypothetical protein MBLNU459_g8477t1 [Dothideomycetes sp. NU459]
MEASAPKKLKSTYNPPLAHAQPLPPGWTEHTAPTGHKYYYSSATKQSTYTRPTAPLDTPANTALQPVQPAPPPPAAAPFVVTQQPFARPSPHQAAIAADPSNDPHDASHPFPFYPDRHVRQPIYHHDHHRHRPVHEDRPKRKAVIPNCAPWILVYTKLGRRFVHNPLTNESFWKFPDLVMKAVIEFDALERDKKLANRSEGTGANRTPVVQNARRRRSESMQREDEAALAADLLAAGSEQRPLAETSATPVPAPAAADAASDDSASEYEEIEVTDDETDEAQPAGEADHDQPYDQPVEFDEDDIAYQLAAMGQDYGLDPGEYGDTHEDWEEGAEGLPLTEQDSVALFRDMLEDLQINPYTPWEKLIDDGYIIEDERYTVLPTTKARKEAWSDWTRDKTAIIRAQRATVEKQDPRIPYLALLSDKATPKLYWPEFKRKFKKEPEMRDSKLSDKDREKLYRDHIARLKLPSTTLKSDLASLLKSIPLAALNRDSTIGTLPKELLTDIRYISLPPKTRDPLIEAHISTLHAAPEGAEAASAEEQAEREKAKRDRERREAAMRDRERRVEEDKRKRERDLRIGMGRLREGERELERAMNVGREGLKAQVGSAAAATAAATAASANDNGDAVEV